MWARRRRQLGIGPNARAQAKRRKHGDNLSEVAELKGTVLVTVRNPAGFSNTLTVAALGVGQVG